jgi:hypothetical protein
MDIDLIVGIMVFLVFTGWALSYYFTIFQAGGNYFEAAADVSQDKLMGIISADVYEAPVKYYSGDAVPNGVLQAKASLYSGEKSSAMVFSGGTPLPCRIVGDDLYWQADVSAGYNYFTVTTAGVNTTSNCTASFSISASNVTTPWVFEKKTMISLAKISGMTGTGYEEFRKSQGLNHNFRIRISSPSVETIYGKSVPQGSVNVNSKTSAWKIYETGEFANVTVAVW